MKKLLFSLLLFLAGCQQSHIKFDSTELWGNAADVYAQQLADNVATTQSRFEDLFKYNAEAFIVLFLVMLGGIAFMILTRSKWGWIIPTVAGIGIASLVFIIQAVEYIRWIVLGAAVVAFLILLWKAWEYQRERNKLLKDKNA